METVEIRCLKSILNVADRAKKSKKRYISGFRARSGPRGRRFESCYPDQQKTHFCLPTKVRFLNDVCLRQMMLVSPMMLAARMMRGFATFYGKHRIIASKTSNIIFAEQMHHIACGDASFDKHMNL